MLLTAQVDFFFFCNELLHMDIIMIEIVSLLNFSHVAHQVFFGCICLSF